ncbi:hypothetical protein F5Y14DRAFT_463716 [Nemania sp. NC0429]|nr:hypothetical protein F5Y14DRAFT_463716 [Nemania sp. NC0429]
MEDRPNTETAIEASPPTTGVDNPEFSDGSSVTEGAEDRPKEPVLIAHATPIAAINDGLLADSLGFENFMIAEIYNRVRKSHRKGYQHSALEQALDYACQWAFVTGYKSVFKVRIGLFADAVGFSHLAVFMSFDKDMNQGSSVALQDTSSSGGPSLMDSTGGQPPQGKPSATQPSGGVESKDVSNITKCWAAGRILGLMLRCYGDIAFPKELWFMEEWKDDQRPSLLLPYSLGSHSSSDRLYRRSLNAKKHIIEEIRVSTNSADAPKEEEGEDTTMVDVDDEEAVKVEEN